jgi:hypothetical protein
MFYGKEQGISADRSAFLQQDAADFVGWVLLNNVAVGAADVRDGHLKDAVPYTELASE